MFSCGQAMETGSMHTVCCIVDPMQRRKLKKICDKRGKLGLGRRQRISFDSKFSKPRKLDAFDFVRLLRKPLKLSTETRHCLGSRIVRSQA